MVSSAAVLAAAETEQDLQVELVRMCVAEAGYDPSAIQPHPYPATGFTFINLNSVVPPEVCWQARELVGIGEPKCWTCTRRDTWGDWSTHCSAGRRFVRDCTDDQGATGRPRRSGRRPRQLPTRR